MRKKQKNARFWKSSKKSTSPDLGVHHPYKRLTKNMKDHMFIIRLDMFKVDVAVFFAAEDVVTYMGKIFGIDIGGEEFSRSARAEAGAIIDPADGKPAFYILYNDDNPNIGTVAHESVHIAIGICTHLGIKFEQKNDETLAYMVDYITQMTVDEMRTYGGQDASDE